MCPHGLEVREAGCPQLRRQEPMGQAIEDSGGQGGGAELCAHQRPQLPDYRLDDRQGCLGVGVSCLVRRPDCVQERSPKRRPQSQLGGGAGGVGRPRGGVVSQHEARTVDWGRGAKRSQHPPEGLQPLPGFRVLRAFGEDMGEAIPREGPCCRCPAAVPRAEVRGGVGSIGPPLCCPEEATGQPSVL